MSLISKVRTCAKIVRESPHPARAAWSRCRYNYLRTRLAWQKEKWFRYRTRHGFPFVVDRAEPMTFWLYAEGHPDVGEIETLRHWTQPGDTCFDIGANIGYMTALLANRVGSAGQVWAAEPGPATSQTLAGIVQRLGFSQVTLVPACVGAETGSVTFYAAVNTTDSPLQGVTPPESGAFAAVQVPQLRIDDLLEKLPADRSPSLVKIDVEGFEAQVLAGATRVLQSERPPLFDLEINRETLQRSRLTVRDLVSYFDARYELHFINLSPWCPKHPWPLNRLIPLPSTNDQDFPPLGSLIALPRVGAFASRRSQLSGLVGAMSRPYVRH